MMHMKRRRVAGAKPLSKQAETVFGRHGEDSSLRNVSTATEKRLCIED